VWGDQLDAARHAAAALKDDILENHANYLSEFETQATIAGFQIHHASDSQMARLAILKIIGETSNPGATIVKGKSMATEEIHLNAALIDAGYDVVETDLGEFVIQLDGDTPSHIVAPIIHKSRKEVSESFAKNKIGEPTEDAGELTLQAREYLRGKFRQAEVGVSGVNFAVAETGRLVIVENEGNNRLSTTAPRIHIAVMGIEKLVSKEGDLPLFLRLLGASSTGQQITTYTHFISGPRKEDELDGPEEVHIILLDNGRSKVLKGPYRSILRCIRCGACQNVCPVYRASSGHAYEHVYGGPIGAVLAPAFDGIEAMGDLADASTLCGACEEVCPVAIPIPDMLLRLRMDRQRLLGEPDFSSFAKVASQPFLWKSSLKMLPLAVNVPAASQRGWAETHELPKREGRDFRGWWKGHSGSVLSGLLPHGSLSLDSPIQNPQSKIQNHGNPQSTIHNSPVPEIHNPQSTIHNFESRFAQLGCEIVELDDLIDLLDKDWLVEPSAKPLLKLGAIKEAENLWDAGVGVTSAVALIAETGSIVVNSSPGSNRMASLAPPIHVVLASKDQVVPSLDDAVPFMKDRTSVIISGPSRTADIEGILIHGVHGPKKVLLVWID
jgi:L-lactate dehydrogenase complex protein LldF